MGANLKKDENGVWVANLSGALTKAELDAMQASGIKGAAPGEKARVLVILDKDFSGFSGSVQEWSDVSFIMKYGDKITKIAIVGDPKWESDMMLFAGAGVRLAPVRYFNPSQLAEAKDWLL